MTGAHKARISAGLRLAYRQGKMKGHTAKAVAVRAAQCRGVPLSPEHKAKMSAALRGKPLSDAHKLAVSAGRKRYFRDHPPEPLTTEHRNKIAIGTRQALAQLSVEAKARMKTVYTPELKVLRSQQTKAALSRLTHEQREQWRLNMQLSWQRLSAEQRKARLVCTRRRSSALETTVANVLDALGINYERQAFVAGTFPDFLIPDRNLILECDGEYWHSRPGRKEYDARRDARLEAIGYRVLRLPEENITSGACEQTLRAVMQ